MFVLNRPPGWNIKLPYCKSYDRLYDYARKNVWKYYRTHKTKRSGQTKHHRGHIFLLFRTFFSINRPNRREKEPDKRRYEEWRSKFNTMVRKCVKKMFYDGFQCDFIRFVKHFFNFTTFLLPRLKELTSLSRLTAVLRLMLILSAFLTNRAREDLQHRGCCYLVWIIAVPLLIWTQEKPLALLAGRNVLKLEGRRARRSAPGALTTAAKNRIYNQIQCITHN